MKLYSKKRKNPIKVLFILALIAVGAFAISKQFANKNVDDVIVAKIGEENIYKSEVERKLNEVFSSNPSAKISFEKLPEQVLEILAREVFLDRKIVAEAKKMGLDSTQEVKDAIEGFKNNTIRQAYVNNSLKDVITDQRIVEKFNDMNAEVENKNEYRYLEIVVNDESKAESLLKDLKAKKKPARFSDLAKKYPNPAKSTSPEDESGFKTEQSISKEVLEVLKNLKKDEVSKPFKSQDSWYIVKLLDTRKPKPIEFESAKEYIRHLIKIEEIEKINGKFIKDLKVELVTKKTEALETKSDEVKSDNPSNAEESKDNSDKSEKSSDKVEPSKEVAPADSNTQTEPSIELKNQQESQIEEKSQKL